MVQTRIQSKRDTTANWNNARGFVPLAGEVIIYTDYKQITVPVEENGQMVNREVNVPGIKVGDGMAYVQDLPFVDDEIRYIITNHINDTNAHTTPEEKAFWSNKINVDDVNDILYDELVDETLVLNRN